eukprot:SAG22_NODE_1154_length_5343_cov_15.970633_5_plen_166_part_00
MCSLLLFMVATPFQVVNLVNHRVLAPAICFLAVWAFAALNEVARCAPLPPPPPFPPPPPPPLRNAPPPPRARPHATLLPSVVGRAPLATRMLASLALRRRELEEPFMNDQNDVQLGDLHVDYNEKLLLLDNPKFWRTSWPEHEASLQGRCSFLDIYSDCIEEDTV